MINKILIEEANYFYRNLPKAKRIGYDRLFYKEVRKNKENLIRKTYVKNPSKYSR